jgi:hypothetical protein
MNCRNLTSVTLLFTTKYLGSACFYNCQSLKTFNLTNIESIGRFCFSNCDNLTTVTNTNNQIKEILQGAFAFCSRLESITFNITIEDIAPYAFFGCTSLKNINIPITIDYIREGIFKRCDNITSVTIQSSVKEIYYHAFELCTNLTSITFSNATTLSKIRDYAFNGCSSLTYMKAIKVSSPVSSDPSTISSGLSGIANLIYSKLQSSSSTIENFNFSLTELNYIGNFAFNECNNLLNDIELKNTIYYIGRSCFRNCMNIRNVIFNASATSIPTECFYSCISITDFTFGQNITTLKQIEDSAFYNCSNLAYITIPTCVSSLGQSCFSHCSKLRSINVLSTNILSLENSLFYRCYYLETFTINNKVTSIGRFCFSGCRSLSKIIVPGTVQSLGVWCFSQYPSSYTDNLFVSDTTSYTVSLVPQTIIFEDPSIITTIEENGNTANNSRSSIFNRSSETTRDITIIFYNSLKLFNNDTKNQITDHVNRSKNTVTYAKVQDAQFILFMDAPKRIIIKDDNIFDRLSYPVITSIYDIYKNNSNIKFELYLDPKPNT